jgi:hypothetical protein
MNRRIVLPFNLQNKKYLPKGAGAIIGFGVKGGKEAGAKFINSLKAKPDGRGSQRQPHGTKSYAAAANVGRKATTPSGNAAAGSTDDKTSKTEMKGISQKLEAVSRTVTELKTEFHRFRNLTRENLAEINKAQQEMREMILMQQQELHAFVTLDKKKDSSIGAALEAESVTSSEASAAVGEDDLSIDDIEEVESADTVIPTTWLER